MEGSREQRAMYWEMFTHVLRLVVSVEHCTSGTQHGTSGGKGATEVRLAEVIIKKPPLFVRQWIVHSLTDTNIISFCLSRVWTNSKYCKDTVLAFQNEVAGVLMARPDRTRRQRRSAALSSASLIPSSTRLHFQSPITLVLWCHEYCCHDELVATLYDDAKLETPILPLIGSGAVTWQELQPIGRRALMDVVCVFLQPLVDLTGDGEGDGEYDGAGGALLEQ